MIVFISADGGGLPSLHLPTVYIADQRPSQMQSGDYYLSATKEGRGERLKRGFAYAFETLGADGVITIPSGGLTEADLARVHEIEKQLKDGADFVDGGLSGGSPFWFSGLFRILTAFTTASRRTPWCGLRGYSRAMAPLLASVKAKGAEYETVLLQAAVTDGVKVTDIPADGHTVEAPRKVHASLRSSFFGAWGIFLHSTSLKFLFSSGVAFLIDYFLLLLLAPQMPFASKKWNNVLAQAIVWVLSSQTNFHLNRLLVFGGKSGLWKSMVQYYSLAIFVLLGKSFLLGILSIFPLWIAKLLCEVSFFLFNYFVQKKLIFRKKK